MHATVSYFETHRRMCPVASNIHILGPSGMVIATAILGGKYNEQQAMREFKRNSKRFKLLPATVN